MQAQESRNHCETQVEVLCLSCPCPTPRRRARPAVRDRPGRPGRDERDGVTRRLGRAAGPHPSPSLHDQSRWLELLGPPSPSLEHPSQVAAAALKGRLALNSVEP
jgi:hypothetical protein